MSNKTQNILDAILMGIKTDPPSDKMLRHAFWEIVPGYRITTLEWRELMDAYVRNPKYSDSKKKKSTHRDRAQRLTTALTGGSDPSKQPEFTWKKFIEGMVALDVDEMTMSVTAKRGKFNTTKTVRATTSPKDDRVKTVTDKEDEFRGSPTSRLIAQQFADTKKTARTMEHVLLRLLWSLLDEYNINKTTWETQVHRYIHNTDNCAQLQHRRNDKKNNLQRAITYRKHLTWNRFLEAMKVIDIKEIEIAFMTRRHGRPSVEACCTIDLTKLSFKTGGDKDETGNETDDVHAE